MGSRMKRAHRDGISPAKTARSMPTASFSIMVPDISAVDLAFGNIAHLPPYADIPDEFKRGHNGYCRLISQWFFRGLAQEELATLTPRDGVEPGAAFRAIGAILRSFQPKHEHKEAGCAYLLSQWFSIKEPA